MAKDSPEQKGKKPPARRYFQFKLGLEGQPDPSVEMMAFAFDAHGQLLDSAPLKDGAARMRLTDRQATTARLFFAPAPPEDMEARAITLVAMDRLRAYKPAWKFVAGERTYELLDVPELIWEWWLWCRCRVRGRVVKPVLVDGVTYDMPVCNARVHVCEVDRLWWVIERIPDHDIFRLRDELIDILRRPEPIPDPLPDPPFEFDPGVIDPSPIELAKMNKAVQVQKFTGLKGNPRMFNSQPEPPNPQPLSIRHERSGDISKSSMLPIEMMVEDQAALLSPIANTVREALLGNLELIYPYLCWWPWIWPYFHTCEEVAVLETNHDGMFDGNIWYLCLGDHPDLYFWVEYNIGGTWTTVHAPPIRCNTHWNYECGSEVTLRVTDPRVPWCGSDPPLPGKQLAVLTMGKNVSMTEIQRQAAGADEGLTTNGQPFGGSLEPTIWFGEDLIPSGITHFRWSFRRLGDLGDWTAIDQPVSRHYGEVMPDSALAFKPFPLGPDPLFPGENLFKVKPVDPPLILPAVSSSWAPEINARNNTATAFFKSHTLEGGDAELAAGKYELKLELFDSGGNLVNLTAEGVKLKVPTGNAPFGVNEIVDTREIPTDAGFPLDPMEERVIRDGTGDVVAFRLVLHVDNNPCFAEIDEVSVDGVSAGPCGFIQYTPGANANVSFVARHPNDFATFNFNIYKGSSGGIVSASGGVGDSPVGGFVRDTDSRFSKSLPVADLVGTCPGGKAAFSETLHVDAIATDGWRILEYLDDNATPKAFALEPGLVIAPPDLQLSSLSESLLRTQTLRPIRNVRVGRGPRFDR